MTGTDFEQTIFPGDGVVSEALNINNPNSLEVGPQRYFFNLLPTTIELLQFRVFEGRSVPAPGLSGPPPTLGDGHRLTCTISLVENLVWFWEVLGESFA